MCLDGLHPALVPGRRYVLALCHRERLLDLANRVCLANIEGTVPLFVGVAKRMPVGRFQLRPRRIVSSSPVSKGVQPALQEMAGGVGLNVNGHVFIDTGLSSFRCEIVERS